AAHDCEPTAHLDNCLFFFSSRRRHTRSKRDWSSDVCSSDLKEGFGKGDAFIIERLKQVNTPKFLLINKVDLIEQDDILPLIATYNNACQFDEEIPISALDGSNIKQLLKLIKSYIPEVPQIYGEDQLTNQSERFFMGEMILEKILNHTEEEVPQSNNVIVESKKYNENGKLHIQETIITERASQKGINIGKNGSMLKKIGREARLELE